MRKLFGVLSAVVAIGALPLLSGCARPASASPDPQPALAAKIREELQKGGAETTAAVAESTGTGWGTLKGKFKFVGTPPAATPLQVNRDAEVCGKGHGLMDNSLVVGADGGIANVVVYARAKRVHESAAPLEASNTAEPLIFDQKDCMFLSHVLGCQVNQTIDIKNSDPVGHNTNIVPQKGVPFNQILSVNQTLNYKPTSEEAFPVPVSCSIHPWMRAYMMPRKDKYFAVTKPDGTFEIPNLPAGEELELQVWHERAGGPAGALVLQNPDLKWTNKGRFKVKLEPDQSRELVLDVPAAAFK